MRLHMYNYKKTTTVAEKNDKAQSCPIFMTESCREFVNYRDVRFAALYPSSSMPDNNLLSLLFLGQ